jgi:short subunit dehydrogenase-like uncharacterized protein
MTATLDLVLFGATGFTGRLVAEHLQRTLAPDVRWALAGRDATRLAQVRDAIGAPPDLPLRVADARDAAALGTLVREARAVITTVGPYQTHGAALVTACAEAGTDYVDLCGEPLWMHSMIPRLEAPARASGARIVFSCGFDSIPFDLGVVFLQSEMQDRLGAYAEEVRARVTVMKGQLSGGTAASALATFERIGREPALAAVMADPFALTPGFRGPPQPDGGKAGYDDWADAWCGPFVMAAINTKNVHRTHALRGHPWGAGFRYDERLQTGAGPLGQVAAKALARQAHVQDRLLGFAPTRALVRRFALPQPGDGPGAHARETGRFEVVLTGQTADGRRLRVRVRGDRDPGYGSTSRMISEAALCLLQDVDRAATPGGVWTAGAAMGLALVRRLGARAGVTFDVID